MLTHISLFSGIGGIDIAAEWAGFETVLFCEKDEYCQKVLNKHWTNVPIIGDIRDVTREAVEEVITNATQSRTRGNNRGIRKGISGVSGREGTKEKVMAYARCEYETKHEQQTTRAGESSPLSFAGSTTNQPITLISGGVPCQPASVAGKRGGTEDDRWLWPEAIRVVSEIKPTWVVFENVSGILTLENGVVFDNLLSELEGEGYETQSFFIPACGVNAPHRRYRVFIVGYSNYAGNGASPSGDNRQRQEKNERQNEQPQFGTGRFSENVTDSESRESREQEARNRGQGTGRGSQEDVANAKRQGLEGADTEGNTRPGGQLGKHGQRGWQSDWGTAESRMGKLANGFSQWMVEPDIPRVATGVKDRVNKLKALGNAVVPQQIYPILKAIAEIEQGIVC